MGDGIYIAVGDNEMVRVGSLNERALDVSLIKRSGVGSPGSAGYQFSKKNNPINAILAPATKSPVRSDQPQLPPQSLMSRGERIQGPENHLQYPHIIAYLPQYHFIRKYDRQILHGPVLDSRCKSGYEAREGSVRGKNNIVKGRISEEMMSDVYLVAINHVFEVQAVLE